MFLLEDKQMTHDSGRPDKTRPGEALIAVLFSAAVIFYIILSLLSAHQSGASPVSVSQTFYQEAAPTVGTGIPLNR